MKVDCDLNETEDLVNGSVDTKLEWLDCHWSLHVSNIPMALL